MLLVLIMSIIVLIIGTIMASYGLDEGNCTLFITGFILMMACVIEISWFLEVNEKLINKTLCINENYCELEIHNKKEG